MDIIKKLNLIANLYQVKLEETVSNYPSGTCYLSAYCLSEYFCQIGVDAKIIIGDMALLNISDQYAVYGTRVLKKSINVGDYHAWCELNINGEIYIIDPSIKYNVRAIKRTHGFKVSKKISNSIISTERETFHWKYYKNDKLIHHYEKWISQAPEKIKSTIIKELNDKNPTLFKVNTLLIN